MGKNIQEIFRNLEIDLALRNEASSEIGNWSRNYFINHRSRYLSEIRMVSGYYSTGEILELGSAPFHFTRIMTHLDLPVTAVDIDPDRFGESIRKWNIQAVKCNIETEELPFEDASFHLVLFNEIFEHMRIDPIHTLKRIRRVLHPDGYFILSTPNLYSIPNCINFLRGKGFDDPYEQFEKIQKFGHMGHVREYSVLQMKKFLENTGFKTIELSMQSHHSLKGMWAPFNIVRKAMPRFHAYQTHVCKLA